MLSTNLIQFSVDGRNCVPSLLFDLKPNNGGGSEDNGDSFKRSFAHTATLSAPDPEAGHHLPTPLLETYIYIHIYVCGWRSLVGCSPWGREESDMT